MCKLSDIKDALDILVKKGTPKKINISLNDKILCSKYRKGHFEGVLAVVDRLMSEIRAKYSYFIQKKTNF